MQFNTIFTGKQFVELDSVDSTNNYAAKLITQTKVLDGTVIMAHFQEKGRGQQGNEWHSNPSENLMCSTIYVLNKLSSQHVFQVSKMAALAVKDTLEKLLNETVFIKWPNDIYIKNKKISGMLIENQWQGNRLITIIGIGINVNQTDFESHLNAMSCKLLSNKNWDVNIVLKELIENLERRFLQLRSDQKNLLNQEYTEGLLFYNQSRSFRAQNELFQGRITEVLDSGHIQITTPSGEERIFAFKEVEFVF